MKLFRRSTPRTLGVTFCDPCGSISDARSRARRLREQARSQALGWRGA